jgi:hypothetical protein
MEVTFIVYKGHPGTDNGSPELAEGRTAAETKGHSMTGRVTAMPPTRRASVTSVMQRNDLHSFYLLRLQCEDCGVDTSQKYLKNKMAER